MGSSSNLLYIKVKQDIIEMIKSLKPNERIPSRTELVKKYNVTRTTIDRAISELIGEGYLYARDGSGTYVSEGIRQNPLQRDSEPVSWGVILPNIMHDTYPGILRGVEDVANKNGINVVICNTDNNNEKQANYIYKLIDSAVKGIIIVPAIFGEIDLTPFIQLQENNIPFVFCNRGIDGIQAPKVSSNNFWGGYIATKHLIKHGYHNIAYISLPLYSVSSERYQGYISALMEANIEPNEDYVIFEELPYSENPGYESAKILLKKNPLPDAIFCFNDEIAKNVFSAVTEAGLRVGRDIGLIGYDNTHLCESLAVKLTSVKFKTYETGTEAAGLLLKIMKGEKVQKNKMIILQPELVVRESCGCGLKNSS